MDEANRQESEDEQYTQSLQDLVKARTDQLQQTVRQNGQLLSLLRQMQSMESLEEIREAIHAAIERFAPQEFQIFEFGGKAGDSVPEVDPDDLKAIWQMCHDLQAQHTNGSAIDIELMQQACKPGADVLATWYRSSGIWMLTRFAEQRLAPWLRDGEIADPVFRTMASIPMQWIGSEVTQSPPMDVEDFFRRLNDH